MSLTISHSPGGKPLPKKAPNKKKKEEKDAEDLLGWGKPRKLLLQWLSVAVLFTLLGNIIVIIVHAIYAREDHWWCGEAPTVSVEVRRARV